MGSSDARCEKGQAITHSGISPGAAEAGATQPVDDITIETTNAAPLRNRIEEHASSPGSTSRGASSSPTVDLGANLSVDPWTWFRGVVQASSNQ